MCKETKDFIKLLRQNGCEVTKTPNNHYYYQHQKSSAHGFFSSTPSDRKALKAAHARAKRQGIITTESENRKEDLNKRHTGYLLDGRASVDLHCFTVLCPNVSDNEIRHWLENTEQGKQVIQELVLDAIDQLEFRVTSCDELTRDYLDDDQYNATYIPATGGING